MCEIVTFIEWRLSSRSVRLPWEENWSAFSGELALCWNKPHAFTLLVSFAIIRWNILWRGRHLVQFEHVNFFQEDVCCSKVDFGVHFHRQPKLTSSNRCVVWVGTWPVNESGTIDIRLLTRHWYKMNKTGTDATHVILLGKSTIFQVFPGLVTVWVASILVSRHATLLLSLVGRSVAWRP